MSEHITGQLTRAGNIPPLFGDRETCGVVIECTRDELREVRSLPMYERVTVIRSDELASLRAFAERLLRLHELRSDEVAAKIVQDVIDSAKKTP